MAQNSPIFIVGAPRSGTTLLTQFLCNHPSIYVFNETLFYDFSIANNIYQIKPGRMQELVTSHLFERLDARLTGKRDNKYGFGGRFTNTEAEHIKLEFTDFLADPSEGATPVALLQKFLELAAKHKGRKRWGEKTPNHVFHLNQITRDFPGVKIIHIIRHPLAFLKSYKYAWRQPGGSMQTRHLYHPIISSMLWRRSVGAFNHFKSSHHEASFYEVKYEELVSQPVSVAKGICNFIEEPFCKQMVEVKSSNTSFPNSAEPLTEVEKSLCEHICSKYMKMYKYSSSHNSRLNPWHMFANVISLIPFIYKASPILRRHFKGSLFKYMRARNIV